MITVLDTGQSNALGARVGGPSFSGLSSRIGAWNTQNQGLTVPDLGEIGTQWVKPATGARPFDRGSGENNAGVWLCDEIARNLNSYVSHLLVARGGLCIENWLDGVTYDNAFSAFDMYAKIRAVHSTSGARPADLAKWHQGESNGTGYPSPLSKSQYKDYFMTMYEGWVSDGLLHPRAPVILCGLVANPNFATITAALAELGDENDNFYYVQTSDLDTAEDNVHLTGQGLYDLGQRCWPVYRDHIEGCTFEEQTPGAQAVLLRQQQTLFNQLKPHVPA